MCLEGKLMTFSPNGEGNGFLLFLPVTPSGAFLATTVPGKGPRPHLASTTDTNRDHVIVKNTLILP